jgi:hypothetical protein
MTKEIWEEDNVKRIILSFTLIFFTCLTIGYGYYNYLQENSNRVIHAFDRTYMTEEYNAPDLKYNDLSKEVQKHVSQKEFESWSTWQDVKISFSKVEPKRTNTSFLFHAELLAAYYEFRLTGYKLRYIEF